MQRHSSFDFEARSTCERCRRPSGWCYCARIPSLSPKTQVLFVQHPREREVAIGTARMAHLALAGSQFVDRGVVVDEHPIVAAALARSHAAPGTVALLFPSDGARTAEEWAAAQPPQTLVVVDGTWSQAKQLITKNPGLASLPRVDFHPKEPGNYRIRKEPTDEHLATIEAVAAVLGIFENDVERYKSLLEPFTYMVDRQLEHISQSEGGRHLKRRRRHGGPLFELAPLRDDLSRALIVYGEVNCHSRDERIPGTPELLHLVAARLDPAATFEAILAPRRPLGAHTSERLGLDVDRIRAGEDVAAALARFRAFSGGGGAPSVWCTWGPFARDILAREGEAGARGVDAIGEAEASRPRDRVVAQQRLPPRGFVDLRSLTARVLRGSPGGIDNGARALGVDLDALAPHAAGRAGRMLVALEAILRALLARQPVRTA